MKRNVCMYIVLWAVLFLVSCSSEKRYVNVLPENAGAVVSLDLKQLVQKSDLSEEDTRALVDKMKNALGDGLDVQSTELIDRILADPGESGLDIGKNVYLFMDAEMSKAGLLTCVQDKEKLDALVKLFEKQKLTKSVGDEGACRMAVMDMTVLAYSENTCLLLFSDKVTENELKKWASDLMSQEEKGSFSESKAFKGMENMNGDISAYVSMDLLPAQYKMMAKASMPATVDWKDIDVLAGMHFEKGRMILDLETVVNDKLKKEWSGIQSIYSHKTTHKFLEMFPKDALMWLSVGLKGDKLYEVLEKDPRLATQLNGVQSMFDLKSMLEAVDGEVVFGLSGAKAPSFALLAEVNNSDFMTSFESLKPMLEMTEGRMKLVDRGQDAYELQMADGKMIGSVSGSASIYLGVKDGVFYLTNEKRYIEEKADPSMNEAVWADNVAGKCCFFALNCQALNETLGGDTHQIYGSTDQLTQMVLNNLDYVTVEAEDDMHGRIELGMKDRDTNVLKQWIGMGKQLAVR